MELVGNAASSCPQIHGAAVDPHYRVEEVAAVIESLFTSALGLGAPWRVASVELNTAQKAHRLQAHPKRCQSEPP